MGSKSQGQCLECFGQCIWPCSSSGHCCKTSTHLSTRIVLRLSRTSTDREVYYHFACHSSPIISSSGVRRGSSHCAPSTFRGSSIVQPTHSHDSSRSPADDWLIWSRFRDAQVDLFASHESSHRQLYYSLIETPSARTHWHTAGLGLYAKKRRSMIGVVLSFLQEMLERKLSPSTLKVYVATITAHHDALDGQSLGKHNRLVPEGCQKVKSS